MAKPNGSDLANAKPTLTMITRLQARKALQARNKRNMKAIDFLSCPFEIRAIVYEEFFAAASCESSDARPEPGKCVPTSDVSVFFGVYID